MDPSKTTTQPKTRTTESIAIPTVHKKKQPHDISTSPLKEKVDDITTSNSSPFSETKERRTSGRRLSNTTYANTNTQQPKSNFTFEIFQESVFNKSAINKLEKQLAPSNCMSREVRFTDCDLTSKIGKRLFPTIASNDNFSSLIFKNSTLDESIFNLLGNALSNKKGRLNNFEFVEIQLSDDSLAHLIDILSKLPCAVLTLDNCEIVENWKQDFKNFNELLNKYRQITTASWQIDDFEPAMIAEKNINLENRLSKSLKDLDKKQSLTIKITNLKVDSNKFSEIFSGILNSNIAELHMLTGQYNFSFEHSVKPVRKISTGLPTSNRTENLTPLLLNEGAKKIIKFYNAKLPALALARIILELQNYTGYRLRLENCTVLFNNEHGLEEFKEILAKTKSEGKGHPLILELIDLNTDPYQGFHSLIEAILFSNISHLHIQKCNIGSAAEAIRQAFESGKCSLDTLQITKDHFDIHTMEAIVEGIIHQNDHIHGLSTFNIEDCGLTPTLSASIGKLIQQAQKLSYIGFSKNQLGSDSITPFTRRRNSSGNILPTNLIRTSSENVKIQEMDEDKKERRNTGELKKDGIRNSAKNLPEKNLKAIEVIASAIDERGKNKNCHSLHLNLSSNELSVNDAKSLESALMKNPVVDDKPPVYVDARGNNLQSKLDKNELANLMNTKGESPRSIIIAHTSIAEIKPVLPELNSNLIKATPRPISISPRRESQSSSPRTLTKVSSIKIKDPQEGTPEGTKGT